MSPSCYSSAQTLRRQRQKHNHSRQEQTTEKRAMHCDKQWLFLTLHATEHFAGLGQTCEKERLPMEATVNRCGGVCAMLQPVTTETNLSGLQWKSGHLVLLRYRTESIPVKRGAQRNNFRPISFFCSCS